MLLGELYDKLKQLDYLTKQLKAYKGTNQTAIDLCEMKIDQYRAKEIVVTDLSSWPKIAIEE